MNTIDLVFEERRPHLHSAASRILGSATDADDAVQEAWLRLRRTDPETIDNPAGWLSTVLARVSFDMLRARTRRPRPGLPADEAPAAGQELTQDGPENEVLRFDSVAGALVEVMDTLPPDQRLAFVLHESFAVSFDAIAGMLSCSPEAARQHASRARRRVRTRARAGVPHAGRHPKVVSAFLAAARDGDVRELAAELHPPRSPRHVARAAMPGYSTTSPDRS
jgi:RNA polymerase sigma-70 factor (ECF subfamily)